MSTTSRIVHLPKTEECASVSIGHDYGTGAGMSGDFQVETDGICYAEVHLESTNGNRMTMSVHRSAILELIGALHEAHTALCGIQHSR